VSTPLRVQATTSGAGGVTLSTQSDQLTITTGIPEQSRFSISATTLNIEGFDVDGVTTTVTARLADHFGNPVPDGTAVNFVAEAGSVGNASLGSCVTTTGACTATVTTQGVRPVNGRSSILGYAVGEETFIDLDGDGLADAGAELVDVNGATTDLPEAFLDSNEDLTRNAGETFIDFNVSGTYNAADGTYNGVLCNSTTGTSTAGTCSAQKSLHIFRNLPIVWATGEAKIQFSQPNVTFAPCTNGVAYTPDQQTLSVIVTDMNDNVMPKGTTIAILTTHGTVTSTANFVVGNSNVCLASSPNCPASAADTAALTYGIEVRTTTTQTTAAPFTCTIPTTSPGSLRVRVTSPGGVVTENSIAIGN
jgi:hypothetical protein